MYEFKCFFNWESNVVKNDIEFYILPTIGYGTFRCNSILFGTKTEHYIVLAWLFGNITINFRKKI